MTGAVHEPLNPRTVAGTAFVLLSVLVINTMRKRPDPVAALR